MLLIECYVTTVRMDFETASLPFCLDTSVYHPLTFEHTGVVWVIQGPILSGRVGIFWNQT